MAWLRVRKFPVDLDIWSIKETDVSSRNLSGLPTHTVFLCLKLQKEPNNKIQSAAKTENGIPKTIQNLKLIWEMFGCYV